MGGASHETVQCLSRGVYMVFGAHGERHLVASASIIEMSKSDGAPNVSEAVYTCDTTIEVSICL